LLGFAAYWSRLSTADAPQPYAISYLTAGIIEDIKNGRIKITGRAADGSVIASYVTGHLVMPTTAWNEPSHDAQRYGTETLKALMPDRRFPFPKALYAVEDCLRHVLAEKPTATVVDFFSGSGTTLHAVLRLNKQDGGRRHSIIVTNNEVAADEQKSLREKGIRPGDPEWERWGICEYITKPRIEAAITGRTPDGEPLEGDYQFTDEFPMADGFVENVESFTLTYEAPLRVASNREFSMIAPLLWIRAGARGRRIDDISKGWDVADAYGVLADLDHTQNFLKAIAANESIAIAYIVTDEDRLFESVAQELPQRIEPVRLYEAYLRNFEIQSGRGLP
jgi:adenine-specific DNA-methyltransferase